MKSLTASTLKFRVRKKVLKQTIVNLKRLLKFKTMLLRHDTFPDFFISLTKNTDLLKLFKLALGF